MSAQSTDQPGGEDAFEIRLLTNVHDLEISTTSTNNNNGKSDTILTSSVSSDSSWDMTYENLESFEFIEFERWSQLLQLVQGRPNLAEFAYPDENSSVFAPNSMLGRFRPESVGNLLLHEACHFNPPVDVIKTLIEAHPEAITTPGHGGLLPLHIACCSGASSEVVAALLAENPTTIKSTCNIQNGMMLPLHVACRSEAKRQVLEVLLTYYPEASAIRDRHGKLCYEYADDIVNPITRHEAMACLEKGELMRTTAAATSALLEAEKKELLVENNGAYEVMIMAMKSKYEKEIHDLNCKLIDVDFEKMTMKEELDSAKAEIDSLKASFKDYKVNEQDKHMKLQESQRLDHIQTQDSFGDERLDLVAMIDKLNETIHELKKDNESQSIEIQRLKLNGDNQEKLHTSMRDAEQKHFRETLTNQLNIEEELKSKVEQVERTNALKTRLLNQVSQSAAEERKKAKSFRAGLLEKLREAGSQQDFSKILDDVAEDSGDEKPLV